MAMSSSPINAHNALIINGRDFAVGDVIEFLGKAHPITRIEAYDVPAKLAGAFPHGARSAYDDSANWGITISNESQHFYCEQHHWWTATGCSRCIHGRNSA